MDSAQRTAEKRTEELDPIEFLLSCGVLEPRGRTSQQIREILAPYLPGEAEIDEIRFLKARERIGKALKPGESFAQLVVQMREE